MQPTNKHEREALKIMRSMSKINRIKWMFRQPYQQLLNLRRDSDSCIVIQSPYLNSVGENRWLDFSLLDKENNIDMAIEIRSLSPIDSVLRTTIVETLFEFPDMPQKELVMVLLGNGFNDRIKKYCYDNFIKNHDDITILYGMDEFREYLRNRF